MDIEARRKISDEVLDLVHKFEELNGMKKLELLQVISEKMETGGRSFIRVRYAPEASLGKYNTYLNFFI